MIVAGWGAATNKGLVRAANEDSFLAEPPVFVVADGMGGHAAGDVASRLAVDSFKQLVGVDALTVNDAMESLATANAEILATVQAHQEMAGMGTTVAGLVVISAGGAAHWQVFNIGDCRVYRLAGGHLAQLTVDHSEAEELVVAGRLSRSEVRTYPRRNVVTRSLGTSPPPNADSWVFPPTGGERFLLCSDGLTNELEDSTIEAVLVSEPDPQSAADRLIQLALSSGGKDNVTTVIVDSDASVCVPVDEDTVPREALNG